MSHFGVLVIGDVSEQLAPFHEFECTGRDDQYVQDIDITDNAKKEFIEEGDEYENMKDFCKRWLGMDAILQEEIPDLAGNHKYGYVVIDSNNNIVKAIDRTNPNKKWDWYCVGGRWSGFLKNKNGDQMDSLCKADWAIEETIAQNKLAANEEFERFEAATKGLPIARRWDDVLADNLFPNIETKRDFYNNQLVNKAWKKANPDEWFVDIEPFLMGRDHYINSLLLSNIVPYAFINNKTWKAKGEMGWFGMSTNEVNDIPNWEQAILEEIRSLPDDTIITIVDCHI